MPGAARDRRNVPLTLAISEYDHVHDLLTGIVEVEGVDLRHLNLSVEEIFFRFVRHREWEVSELSLAKYCFVRSRGDEDVVAIPVFPSRAFRHSAFFVREDSDLGSPEDLRGRRIGIPEWTVTATVYARALLQHEYGVPLTEVHWVQAGTNQPGRTEGVDFRPPPGVTIEPLPDRSLNELLLAGELDALIAPHPPAAFSDGSGRIVRLVQDYRTVEGDYYGRTGVFPIMHLIALRADVHREYPWIAMNLLTAFSRAKERSVARALDPKQSHFPLPWGAWHGELVTELFGADPWPYGLEANRVTLDAFLGFAHEQGVCARRLRPEELFPAEVLSAFVV